jgi:hypothetical protein
MLRSELDMMGFHVTWWIRFRVSQAVVFCQFLAKDRTEKPFAMSYIKLMNNNGTTLSDTVHDLLVYRVS